MQMFFGGKLGNLCSTAPFPYKSSIIYIIMHNWNWFRGPNGYSLARLDGQSVDAVAISSRNALGAKMNIIRWDARIQFPVDTHTHTRRGHCPPCCGDRWQPDWVKEQLAAERETCYPDWFLTAGLRFLKLTGKRRKTNINRKQNLLKTFVKFVRIAICQWWRRWRLLLPPSPVQLFNLRRRVGWLLYERRQIPRLAPLAPFCRQIMAIKCQSCHLRRIPSSQLAVPCAVCRIQMLLQI